MEITAIAQEIINSYTGLIWVKNIRTYFYWSNDLNAWVVLSENDLNTRIDELTDSQWEAAVSDGRFEVIKAAMKYKEKATITRLQRSIASAVQNPIEILQGGIDARTAEEPVLPVTQPRRKTDNQEHNEEHNEESQKHDDVIM